MFWSSLITRVMGRVGLLRNYADQVRSLSEMAADDHAAARFGRHQVATALLALCTVTPAPGGSAALPMAGSHAAERIRRLVETTARPVVQLNQLLTVGSAAALILLPLALVLGPAVALAGTHHG